jgi:hypothetical protein
MDVKVIFIWISLLSMIFAHTAMMRCLDSGDGTVFCEAGFSDGSSAEGMGLLVIKDGKRIFETKFDDFGEVSFKKPSGDYTVILDGGDGHTVSIQGKNIIQ